MARLGLTGDVMLGRLVDDRQRERGRVPESVWGTMFDRLRGLDGLAINLECAISTRGTQWTRTDRPFHFRADPGWAVPALDRAGVSVANLANNHLLDYREPALADTIEHLDGVGIATAGAGESSAAARDPALVSVSGLDIAVISFTDNTPEYAAKADRPGVSYLAMDRASEDDAVRETAASVLEDARALDPDLVMASLHWGPNMVTEPSEAHREFGRWLAERVDLVHGHSAHVIQGVEIHDGTPILYDCGDFVDDYRVDPDLHNDRSFLFVADIDTRGVERLRLVPVEIYGFGVHSADGEAARWLRRTMRERSRPFGTTFERDGDALVCHTR